MCQWRNQEFAKGVRKVIQGRANFGHLLLRDYSIVYDRARAAFTHRNQVHFFTYFHD